MAVGHARAVDLGSLLGAHAVNVTHHFGAGTYIKETEFDAGETVPMHKHVHTHQSVLCSGWALLSVDRVSQEIRGPQVLTIEAGHEHEVRALTRITWLCIHASDETDPDKIDHQLVG